MRRQWRIYGRYEFDPASWVALSAAMSDLNRCRVRVRELFAMLQLNGCPLIEARITGPGVSLRIVPRWPGPGEDFEMIESDELALA